MQENDRRERHKRSRGGASILILCNKKRARQHHKGLTSQVHASQVERIGIIADAKTADVKKIQGKRKHAHNNTKKTPRKKTNPISEDFFCFWEKKWKKNGAPEAVAADREKLKMRDAAAVCCGSWWGNGEAEEELSRWRTSQRRRRQWARESGWREKRCMELATKLVT